MERGFLSIFLILMMVVFLTKNLEIYSQVHLEIQEMKNNIVLLQEVNEKIYDLEDGFVLTIKEALREANPPKNSEEELIERTKICIAVVSWFHNNYPEYDMYAGEIDPLTYKESAPAEYIETTDSTILSLGQDALECMTFLRIEFGEKKVTIKDNREDCGDYLAFVFTGQLKGVEFKAIIPHGTVIE